MVPSGWNPLGAGLIAVIGLDSAYWVFPLGLICISVEDPVIKNDRKIAPGIFK